MPGPGIRARGRRFFFLAVAYVVCFAICVRKDNVRIADGESSLYKFWPIYRAEPETAEYRKNQTHDSPDVIHDSQPSVPHETTAGTKELDESRPVTAAPTHPVLQDSGSVTSGPSPSISTTASEDSSHEEEDCTPPAYREFPPDLFTHKQRMHGAIVIHLAVIIYMFYAVAVVCDHYFIASLEECCARLQLSEDVAGATFMAAGSSAPELFTAILGVLVAKGDVGTGTIVGSAVFNVLFVIGICGLFAGRVVELTWWPLFRDSIFYSFTVVILICFIFDSEVTWYESVIMMSMYSVYIVIMKFSNDLHFWFSRKLGLESLEDSAAASLGILGPNDKKNYSSYVPFNNEIDECAVSGSARFHNRASDPPPADERIRDGIGNRMSLYNAALRILMKRPFPPKTRFRSAALLVMLEHQRYQLEEAEHKRIQPQISLESTDLTKWRAKSASVSATTELEWKKIPSFQDGVFHVIKWVIQFPLFSVMHYTIPDCRQERWRKFFMLTFVMSITWTAVFSYIMVWMVTLVGYDFGIPDSIMGITFLAAGTSVPDGYASLIVARQGQGDMAVSNSIGSNVFDILIGLAFPWFIQTAIVDPGSIATINSRGMVYSVVLLFLTIIITIAGIYFSKWQLTPRLGFVLLSVYVVFLIISVLLEFNLLGYVNPPMCPD